MESKESQTKAPRKSQFELKELKFPIYGVEYSEFKKGELDRLLAGGKSMVHKFKLKVDPKDPNSKWEETTARMQLHRKEDGTTGLKFIPKVEKFEIKNEYFGVTLNQDVIDRINSNKAVLVDGFVKNGGEPFSMWLSKDNELNRVEMTSAKIVPIPNYVHGVKLTEDQAKALKSGEKLILEVKAAVDKKNPEVKEERSIEVYADMNRQKVVFNYLDKTQSNGKKVENKTTSVIKDDQSNRQETKKTSSKRVAVPDHSEESTSKKKSMKVA